jgi:circadian clock protein KaiC
MDHLYLIDGEPGTGKTTLALQFLLAGAKVGRRVMYVTLSETQAELRDVASSHGWNLDDDDIDVFELSNPEGGESKTTTRSFIQPR